MGKVVLILAILLTLNLSLLGQEWSGDTLKINPITFNDPSPSGWNAQYKTLVKFPEEGEWSKILMLQTLKCDSATAGDKYPCGEWDYIWNTFIKSPITDTTEVYTLGSFVTPYGKRLELGGEKGWQWEYDITDYAPILIGEVELEAGNNQELLNLEFLFIKGVPPRNVISVKNIYPYGEYKYEYLSSDSLLKETNIVLTDEAKAFSIKATISGHGHAGPYNCCEWDSKTHTYRFNGWQKVSWSVWKDCGNNPIYPQGGTWPFDRAGWCPGTKVDVYEYDLTPKVSPGDTISFDYSIEPYRENGEQDGTFRMSHQLFSYGPPNYKVDAAIKDIITPNDKDAYRRLNPSVGNHVIIIRNQGANQLTALDIRYGIEGKRKKVTTWRGNLGFLEEEVVSLPALSWKSFRESGTFEVEVETMRGVVDENQDNNLMSARFTKPVSLPQSFILSIHTNDLGRAADNHYYINDASGLVWYEQSEFLDSTQYRIPIDLSRGSYEFIFSDDQEDGISKHWWYRNSAPEHVGIDGRVQIESAEGDTLLVFPPDFGEELRLNFIVE